MRAVIFDMDGVIVDSEPLWRSAEREVFADVGLELSDEDCEKTMGMRTDEVAAYWFGRTKWTGPSPSEIAGRIERRVRELIIERAQPMPGLHDAIKLAGDAGLRIALASSSNPDLIAAVLEKLSLEQAFEVVCSALNEEFGKPHPAVFFTAARELGVEGRRCVVIEDSIAGVRAGRAASMRVIAVPPPNYFDRPEHDLADFKLRSLEELTLEMLRFQ